MSFLVLGVGLFVLWFFVLVFVFVGDTLIIVSPFLSYGGIANQTRCIDNRLSFKRARPAKKKLENGCVDLSHDFKLSVSCRLC